MDSKYDLALESSTAAWISGLIGEKVSGPFNETLKDGIVLCKYVEHISIFNFQADQQASAQYC